jgi:hypothetical protein
MKFRGSLFKRIELIAFILGLAIGIYMLMFFPARYFFTWHRLPITPERVTRIISAHLSDVIVQTTSNKKYSCNIFNEKECWTKVDYTPLQLGKTSCFMNDCPNTNVVQITRAIIQVHNFGEVSNIYALHNDGTIYVKQTGFVYLEGYVMGVLLGAFCASITFVCKYIFRSITSLFRAGSNK